MKSLNEFKVWCMNKNEWEKDTCLLTQSGQLVQDKGGLGIIPCSAETHIVCFWTKRYDKNQNKLYQNDIVKLDVEYHFDNGHFDIDENCTYYGVIQATLSYGIKLKCYKCFDNENEVWLTNFSKYKHIASYRTEKLGNIFENKSLLEVKKDIDKQEN